jgi:hypothetical protein
MSVPCDDTDKRLFQAATTIELGNGAKINFWHDNWLQNSCPKDIAPLCFKLAKRKQKGVHQELHNNNWLISFRQITSIEEIHELVHLGSMLQGVMLTPRPDDISWNWNGSKVYTILHQKTLTAQNLLRRHWPCNWICSLCTSAFEDTNHLFSECPFFKEVWSLVTSWQHLSTNNVGLSVGTSDWWAQIDCMGSKEQKKAIRGALLTTWWNVWLERNRRIFNNISILERAVAYIVKQDLDLRCSAFRPP